MKLKCPLCGLIFSRTQADIKRSMTKRGYKTWCEKKQKDCFAKPVAPTTKGEGEK